MRNERYVAAGEVVRRTVGFATDFEYVAEVTADVNGLMVTARECGHTREGAVARARAAVRERAMFAGFRRAVGFAADAAVRRDTHVNTGFRVGFAGGAA